MRVRVVMRGGRGGAGVREMGSSDDARIGVAVTRMRLSVPRSGIRVEVGAGC